MDLQEFQMLLNAAELDRVLLEKSGEPRLEAFSGNAIYSRRGMTTMNKYKTVKEVCDLTDLTRKHLYYFHHENVVRAVAYANYSVEGYNGYKLYDDIAVEKLQQIALYYQLGLKRDEIKEIMLTPNYDSNMILHALLAMEQEKKLHIERHIAALEYLILAGTKNGVSGSLRGISIDELGRTLLAVREASAEDSSHALPEEHAAIFAREFSSLISEFAQMDEALLLAAPGAMVIQKIIDLSNKYLGSDSSPFVLGLFMSVLGEGSIAQGITDKLTPIHGRAVIQYMIDHPQIYSHTPTESMVGVQITLGGKENEKDNSPSSGRCNAAVHGSLRHRNAPKQRYPTRYIQHRCSCNRPFCGNDGTLR